MATLYFTIFDCIFWYNILLFTNLHISNIFSFKFINDWKFEFDNDWMRGEYEQQQNSHQTQDVRSVVVVDVRQFVASLLHCGLPWKTLFSFAYSFCSSSKVYIEEIITKDSSESYLNRFGDLQWYWYHSFKKLIWLLVSYMQKLM